MTGTIRRATLGLVAALATLAAAITMLLAPTARADTVSHYGCAAGWVCLSAENAGLSGSWIAKYYYYGYDNLSDVTGTHTLLNNQTSNAWAYVCYNYGGTNCPLALATESGTGYYGYVTGDFKPINSVRLSAIYHQY